VLGIPAGTVKSRLSPSRGRLRRLLQTSESVNHPALTGQRRRRTRLVAAAVTVALVTTGISVYANTGGGATGNGPAAFAVERLPAGPVRIRIIHTDLNAQEMTRQLKAEGLNITIETVPVNAQLVGEWLTFSSSGGGSAADSAAISAQMQGQPTEVEIPRRQQATWSRRTSGTR
jgi:hypothetical protein